jgi:hypothetical protein
MNHMCMGRLIIANLINLITIITMDEIHIAGKYFFENKIFQSSNLMFILDILIKFM